MAHNDETPNIDLRSARGWQPKDPYIKLRERAQKQLALQPKASDTMLELRPARQWVVAGGKQKPPGELYGPLWREGEVAVFFGEKGVGKSIFAVQLAEAIASGRRLETGAESQENGTRKSLVARLSSRVSPAKPVLFFDFELTEQQFTERYSVPPPLPGKLPLRPQFQFTRAAINWDGHVPPAFKGDANRFLLHSIFHAIAEANASVVIIDSITYLAANVSSNSSCLRLMKTLRQWASSFGISILVLANAKPQRPRSRRTAGHDARSSRPDLNSPFSIVHSPFSLLDLAGSRHIGEMADSVFCLGRSTFGPEFRYIKHLASRTADTHSRPHEVLTYSVRGMDNGQPTVDDLSENSQFSTINYPFLYLGPSSEFDHLRDYEREAIQRERSERDHARRLARRSAKDALIEGMMDGSYRKYLNGE